MEHIQRTYVRLRCGVTEFNYNSKSRHLAIFCCRSLLKELDFNVFICCCGLLWLMSGSRNGNVVKKNPNFLSYLITFPLIFHFSSHLPNGMQEKNLRDKLVVRFYHLFYLKKKLKRVWPNKSIAKRQCHLKFKTKTHSALENLFQKGFQARKQFYRHASHPTIKIQDFFNTSL